MNNMMNNMGMMNPSMNPMMMNNQGNMNTMMMNNMNNMMMNNNMNMNTMMMNNNMNDMNMNPMMNSMNQGNMNTMMMNNMNNMNNNMNNMNMNPMMNSMNQGNMNPMMMNNNMNMNTMMMNMMMMNNMNQGMNPMMMNNMTMMNNPLMMSQMMNMMNNQNQGNNDDLNSNNQNQNNVPAKAPVPDLSEKIKKEEKEKKKKLMKQIINKEGHAGPAKHCKELEIISDMAIMGSITKDYITADKQNNPNKYISTTEALTHQEKYYNILGILADYLTKQGVLTAIEKKDQNKLSSEKLKEIDTFLQFLINGLTNLKKHELRFDFGWEKNQLILTDIKEQEDFMDELRYALHQGLNIPADHMVITYPRSGSVLVTVVFNTEDYNNLQMGTLNPIFAQHAPDLNHLKSIESNLILDGILLNPELLDSKGNNQGSGWGVNEQRGGRPYNPPLGWVGYGLKVVGKYDNGNNDWLDYRGVPGEWCVAYHGASQKINQNYNLMRDDDDLNHPGQKVGEGVYCCPKPYVLDNEGGVVQINNKKYKIGFMLRVRPNKIREAKSNPDYWVLNGNSSEIRPYRILIKELN